MIDEELDRFRSAGAEAGELARAKTSLLSEMVFELERGSSRANHLNTYNHYTGDPGYLKKYLEEVRTRTPDSVRMAARRWLAKPRVEIVTVPAPAPAPITAGGAQ